MEITLDTLISLLSLLLGGGAGAVFTWRWQRAKAKAEAKQAEVDATKEMQDVYQQLIADVKQDRSEQRQYITELKQDREDLRLERNKMQKRLTQLSDEVDGLKRTQSRQGRQIEAMRPFLCADLKCPNRVLMQWDDVTSGTSQNASSPTGEGSVESDEVFELLD